MNWQAEFFTLLFTFIFYPIEEDNCNT